MCIDALINTSFSQSSERTFIEYLVSFEEKQIISKGLILIFSLIYGIVLQYYHIRYFTLEHKLKIKNTELERHQLNTNHILTLASNIAAANITNPDVFLSNLLVSAIDIIDETNNGFAFQYLDDHKVIIAQSGLSSSLVGIKFRLFLKMQHSNDIIIINNFKQFLLENVDDEACAVIEKHLIDSNESLVILCEQDNEKVAGIVLNNSSPEGVAFSDKSLELARLLKNIPIAFYKHLLFHNEKEKTFSDIIKSIIKLLTLHNKYTKDHSVHVANLSKEIAIFMKLKNDKVEEVYWAGIVHDISKILISDKILNKKGALTPEEFEIVKKHTSWGYETLRDSPNLQSIAKYILYHHEKWDGTGYPHGISGETIPLASRILSIADTYDALTSHRSYRKALSQKKALEYIKTNANIHFDPAICDVFVDNFSQIIKNSYDVKDKI